MRIGEILHRDGLVSAEDLASALADQTVAGKRLCSLLVVRGVIDADQAARALAEQFDVSAALMKHINHRDRSLEKLVPANLARQHSALPIGKLRDGEIVLCVRDPKPHTQATFERVLQKPVLITVACAHVLDPLIDATYPPAVTQDFGVRFSRPSTSPAANPPPEPSTFAAGTERQVEPELQLEPEREAEPELVMPETFALVDLDDAGVDKKFVMKTPRTPTLPPLNAARPPVRK